MQRDELIHQLTEAVRRGDIVRDHLLTAIDLVRALPETLPPDPAGRMIKGWTYAAEYKQLDDVLRHDIDHLRKLLKEGNQ